MKITKQQLLTEYRSGLIDVAPMSISRPDSNFLAPLMKFAASVPQGPLFNYSNVAARPVSPFVPRPGEQNKPFESPLYNPKSPQPSKVPQYTPTVKTVAPQGGEYSTTFTADPTVQQRLRLTGADLTDSSLSRKERGVPRDKSEELVGKMEPASKGSWINLTRTVFNPNYRQDLMRASSVVPTMVTKYTTFYDRIFKPAEEEED